jgi:predicted  nucleic acid-binding Zn-ribbon protein
MNRQLELIITLHDLNLLRNEINGEKKAGFKVQDHENELNTAKEKVLKELDTQILKKFEKLADKYPRAIVPVIDGICYGCFVTLPTAFVVRKNKNEEVNTCPNCGRFIYWFED